MVVQILFATRELGLNESQVGLCYVGLGLGSVLASAVGNRVSQRVGPGPCLVLGCAVCGLGWLQRALAPANAWGVASLALAAWAWRTPVIRNLRVLPMLGANAAGAS